MPGVGHWWVLLILAAIALIIFGPSRLPELGAGLGKAIREFRKATTEMGDALKEEAHKPNETTPTAVGTTYPAPIETAPTGTAPTSTDRPTTPGAPVTPGAVVTPGAAVTPSAPTPQPEPPKA